jgi:hypothetical protein
MTTEPRWRLGPLRHATRNILLPLNVQGRAVLIKYTRDRDEARKEIRGHARLLGRYPVPALHTHLRVPGGYLLAYERLPSGPDRGLLLDLLNTDEPTAELHRYMDELTAAYREVVLESAQELPPTDVVRKLYWERAAAGGRLDAYYAGADFPVADGIIDLPVTRLAEYVLVVNGQPLSLGWTATLRRLRSHFERNEPVWAALTQGDPTDVNLAHPLAWLDYDTAGLNSILGEFANFLWYVTALGGWLVPTYNPAAFADHPATFQRVEANRPQLQRAYVNHSARTSSGLTKTSASCCAPTWPCASSPSTTWPTSPRSTAFWSWHASPKP